MAITNAQQARQLYKNGSMKKIKGQNHMLAYITPGERDMLVDLGGQETMTKEGILAYPPGGGDWGGSMSESGGGGGGRDRDNDGGDGGNDDNRRQQRQTNLPTTKPKGPPGGGTKTKTNIDRTKLAEQNRLEKERVEKARIAQELFEKKAKEEADRIKAKEEEEKKKAKELSDLGKSKTTKFGTVVGPTAKSTLDRFKADRYFDERLGYVDEFGNPIGNTLGATLTSLSTPTKTTDGITSVVNNVPEGIATADDIREQYGVLRSTTPKNQEIDFNDVFEAALDRPLDKSSDLQTAINDFQTGRYNAELDDLLPGDEFTPGTDVDLNKREKALQEFLDRRNEVKTFGLSSLFKSPLQKVSDFNASINRPFFEDVIRGGKIPGLDFDMTANQFEDAYQSYMSDRLAGKTDAYGNPTSGYSRDASGNIIGSGNDGGDNYVPPIVPKKDDDDDDDDTVNPRDYTGLGARFLGSEFDFTGLADGGIARAGYMDGGMPKYQGGIMDLETGRQMYFLGKLVKKATRAVKKVAKSPFGKAALLYFGGGALGNLAGGSGLGGMFRGAMTPSKFLARSKLSNIFTKGGAKNILFGGQKLLGNPAKNNFVDFSGILGSGGKFSIGKALGLGLGIPTALDLMGVGKEEDEALDLGPGIDIRAIRNSPYRYLAPRFTGSQYEFADGGRIGYAEGSKEPVAKETMPLLDMDNQEMDLRAEGGFVPIGRMERADDVPARLSKNEFVFTADAVRNAGEGDIDKGAEVMYNMMKNLESGGEVSEESQGLDGAREMFQTSQRLEEVL